MNISHKRHMDGLIDALESGIALFHLAMLDGDEANANANARRVAVLVALLQSAGMDIETLKRKVPSMSPVMDGFRNVRRDAEMLLTTKMD